MKPLAVISSRCLFIRVFITKHASAFSICQERRQPEASSKARDFNEFYLLNKSVNDVMKKTNKQKDPVSAKRKASLSPVQNQGRGTTVRRGEKGRSLGRGGAWPGAGRGNMGLTP